MFLIAIAIAFAGGSRSAQAGVLTDWNWSDGAVAGHSGAPSETPKDDAFNDGSHSGMEGVRVSNIGGSQSVGLSAGLCLFAILPVTGRAVIADWALPDAPFLDGLPKPA